MRRQHPRYRYEQSFEWCILRPRRHRQRHRHQESCQEITCPLFSNYMGDNTLERREFIMTNLRIEDDENIVVA